MFDLAPNGVTSANILDGQVSFADWSANGCAANQIPKWNGRAWVCAVDLDTDTNTIYSAGSGLLLSANTFSLSLGGVAESNLGTGVVTAAKIALGAVGTDRLTDGAVTATKIAPAAVTSSNVADNSLTAADLAPSSVTSSELADRSVTGAKLAAGLISVPASAFVNDQTQSGCVLISGINAANFSIASAASNCSASAAVILPNGVTVTELSCYVTDNDPGLRVASVSFGWYATGSNLFVLGQDLGSTTGVFTSPSPVALDSPRLTCLWTTYPKSMS